MGVHLMFMNKQTGISFIEMILSLVIVSITFTGTLQIFGTLLNWSVYPFIEKQAIVISQSIFSEVGQGNIKNCTLIEQTSCLSHDLHDIVDVLPFYRDVTQKHFTMRLTTKSMLIQEKQLRLWNLELRHNQGDQFRFSWMTR